MQKNNLTKPAELYAKIRARNPEPLGKHWDGTGTCLGSGIWADPVWSGQPGEYEFMYQARSRSRQDDAAAPSR